MTNAGTARARRPDANSLFDVKGNPLPALFVLTRPAGAPNAVAASGKP